MHQMTNSEKIRWVTEIFMPHAVQAQSKFKSSIGRLAHYTTAQSAIEIIRSKSIWLRNSRHMADFSEIEHGFDMLRDYFHRDSKKNLNRYFEAFSSISKEGGKAAIEKFDANWEKTRLSTYITCFSEHAESEDVNGRLSLWRAFGQGESSVALVLRGLPKEGPFPLGVFFSPVAYFSADMLSAEMDAVIENISKNADELRSFPVEWIVDLAYRALVFAVVSLKHAGFGEEKEWRLVYLPDQTPSKFIVRSVQTVRGTPQIVYKVEMKNYPEEGIVGIEMPEILDRVIVGPTQHGLGVYDAFVEELSKAGVERSFERVFISQLPLRG